MANFNELILGFGNTVALDNILAVPGGLGYWDMSSMVIVLGVTAILSLKTKWFRMINLPVLSYNPSPPVYSILMNLKKKQNSTTYKFSVSHGKLRYNPAWYDRAGTL